MITSCNYFYCYVFFLCIEARLFDGTVRWCLHVRLQWAVPCQNCWAKRATEVGCLRDKVLFMIFFLCTVADCSVYTDCAQRNVADNRSFHFAHTACYSMQVALCRTCVRARMFAHAILWLHIHSDSRKKCGDMYAVACSYPILDERRSYTGRKEVVFVDEKVRFENASIFVCFIVFRTVQYNYYKKMMWKTWCSFLVCAVTHTTIKKTKFDVVVCVRAMPWASVRA